MISGYSETGNLKSEMMPQSKMRVERTPAKMGRSIKNLDDVHVATLRVRMAQDSLASVFRAATISTVCGWTMSLERTR